MPDLFVLLNHELTNVQIKNAIEFLGIKNIREPDDNIKIMWSSISPEGALNINDLEHIIDWLKITSTKKDYVLVQGEFGATFYIVDFCFKWGLIPIYATSERKYNEVKLSDGSVRRIHTFNHVQFRKYVKYREL